MIARWLDAARPLPYPRRAGFHPRLSGELCFRVGIVEPSAAGARITNASSRLLKKAARSRRLDEVEEIVVPWILRGDLASANEDLGECDAFAISRPQRAAWVIAPNRRQRRRS